MKYLFGFLIAVVVMIPVLLLTWELLFSWWIPVAVIDYSDGQRTGLLTKISYKGFPCKTWNGYILVGNGQNVAPETFYFNVKDDEVAHQIEKLDGKLVKLNYHEYMYTSTCYGASHVVTSVEEKQD